MPTEAKRQTVAELAEAFSAHPTSIVADYGGLSVADLATIRRSLRERGVSYRIVKNRLAIIAAQEAGMGELEPLLEGRSGVALGAGDETQVAKSFLDAIRPYRAVVVRGGVIGRRRIDADGVTRLAALPGREVLLGQLAGSIAAPLSGMASLLSAPLRNLGYALAQVRDQKAAGGDAATTTAG